MKPKKAVRAKVRKPKLEPWRAELARIVKFLNKNDEHAKKLWWVLSALRGPDFDEKYPYKEKKAITGVLRQQIGLKPLSIAYVNETDSPEYAEVRAKHLAPTTEHFYYHGQEAFYTLGLKWDATNSTENELKG